MWPQRRQIFHERFEKEKRTSRNSSRRINKLEKSAPQEVCAAQQVKAKNDICAVQINRRKDVSGDRKEVDAFGRKKKTPEAPTEKNVNALHR